MKLREYIQTIATQEKIIVEYGKKRRVEQVYEIESEEMQSVEEIFEPHLKSQYDYAGDDVNNEGDLTSETIVPQCNESSGDTKLKDPNDLGLYDY